MYEGWALLCSFILFAIFLGVCCLSYVDIAIRPQRLLEVFPRLEVVLELVVEEENPCECVFAGQVRER